jgi:hypothetical protein
VREASSKRRLLARTVRAGYRSGSSGSWGRAASGGRGALTFGNGRETVRGRHAIFTAARDPDLTSGHHMQRSVSLPA